MKHTLHNQIMRQVYLAFAKRLVTHQVTLQAALFVFALALFGELVHVKRIFDTLVSLPLGNLPGYITNALLGGEVLTLMTVGAMLYVVLALGQQVRAHLSTNRMRPV